MADLLEYEFDNALKLAPGALCSSLPCEDFVNMATHCAMKVTGWL